MKIATRAGTLLRKAANYLSPLSSGWWWPSIRESYTGAWQSNVTVDHQSVSANWAVFACVTLIAGDIAKMPARVMKYMQALLIWEATRLRPVLRKPNRYQTWPDFVRSWVFSLLLTGNTYVLKERNREGLTVALYVLSPGRVRPLVSQDGSVYYDLSSDNLSDLQVNRVVPASEIMHDRINTIWHPLVGVSPIYASGVAAMQALAIQDNSAKFFQNMSKPGGVMTAPGAISDESAARLKASFQENFSGSNLGNLLVLGDGVTYVPMTITAHDSQLIEQLKFTGEMICATFHVPPYKLGLGPMPTVNNTAALNQQYYDQCLHPIVDGMERRLDEGLEIANPFAIDSSEQLEVWFDTSELLRMDPATRADANAKKIASAILSPNEARRDENMPPVTGGDSPYLQQQNFSLAALAKRDATDNPFGTESSGGDGEDPLKNFADAYGVGVRAGLTTPQVDDEEFFRSRAGFPPLSADAKKKWEEFGGTRDPITLRALVDQFEKPDELDGSDDPDNDDGLPEAPDAKRLSRLETRVTTQLGRMVDAIGI